MDIIYQDEYIELRKSNIDHCMEYIRKKLSPDIDTDKEILNKLAFQIKDNVYYKVICDVSKLDYVQEGTIQYLRNFCLPFLATIGARVFAVVTGEDKEKKKYYQGLVIEMSEIINDWDLQYSFFNDVDEAKKWIINK